MKRLVFVFALGLPLACAGGQSGLVAKAAGPTACNYRVTLVSAEPAVLEVDARCTGKTIRSFVASEAAVIPHLSDVRDGDGNALEPKNDRFSFDEPTSSATIHYRLDLESVAKEQKAMDVALRQGRSLVAPVSTWLLRPEPSFADLRVRVHVEVPKGASFTTGLRRLSDDYTLFAHEISVSTYGVFGRYASKHVSLPGRARSLAQKSARPQTELEIVLVDGAMDAPKETLFQWVRDTAAEVGKFWRGFPVEHTLVILLPVPGRHGVVFGKVLPESSPGVIVLVGEHSTRERLYDDWVLVHELFHLGVPSFNREGKWFDEGLATYYEPLIRARAGWRTELDVWSEFADDMRQGLRAINQTGLDNPGDYPDIYWGGAVFCLLADLEFRKKSEGKRGLEDGLIRVLDAGGNASEVWPLERTLALADEKAGVLPALASAHQKRGKKVDFERLLLDLGVVRRGDGIELRDDAPMASLRRALVFGGDSKP